jgi:hypothetical protein
MHFGAMKRIVFAEALPGWRLHLRYDDGVEGTVDLSAKVGKGVFTIWRDPEVFARFKIESDGRSLVWPGEVDACADALYLEITGMTAEELWSGGKPASTHA